MKVFCYLTTSQKSYTFCFFVFLLQPWISSVRLYVYYQASKIVLTPSSRVFNVKKHISCVLTCRDLLPDLEVWIHVWKKSPSNMKPCHSHVKTDNSRVKIAFIRIRNKCPIHMSHYFIFFRILQFTWDIFMRGHQRFHPSVSQRTWTCGCSYLLYDQRNETRRQPQREKRKKTNARFYVVHWFH